jgi:hypothetical protein
MGFVWDGMGRLSLCRNSPVSVSRGRPARSRYGTCRAHWLGNGTAKSQTSERLEVGKPMDHPQDRHLKQCDLCEQPAAWVRRTQFAGNHFFCAPHAKLEEDFGLDDPSYFFWEQLTSYETAQTPDTL